MPATRVIVFDVNETLSDLEPMAQRFTDIGLPAPLAATWFAQVLRDGFALTSPAIGAPGPEQTFDAEIQAIRRTLDEHGTTERRELAGFVGARYWGPGVFRQALREAVADGDVRRPAMNDDRACPVLA